ncbi:glycosyltransferase family 4 protein [Ferruginibacter sp. HRS2-29]|uniref:glycosyltransferase family 4 protein n=1 Tax=Ferruginibacter sp. HRS2-29 TaxID=2487334 RepID=UPI0020CD5809|nr:glycosyltransferase family 4 protein [Ferruginibacter sp. HRS2-29]MCP9751051.1 glycosyltransferase family 1 protein [Ferruginibacter sp. HRS2-29]
MRVMILVPALPLNTDDIRGGVHSAVANLLRGFVQLPVTVRVVSFNKEVSSEQRSRFSDNIEIVYCPEGRFPLHSLNYLLKCAPQVRKHIGEFRPDLIHYEASDAFLFTKLFGLRGVKHLLTIHGIAMAEGKVNKNFRYKMSSYFNGLVEKIMFPKNIIHLSSYSVRMYGRLKINKYSIIPNAVMEGYFALPVKEATENKLLYIGGIDRNKNILFLLKGLKEMRDRQKTFTIDILGGFKDQEFEKEINEYIRLHALAPYLNFHGWVPQSAVMNIVAGADILVVSSLQESLPMVIAECMSAGKTVIGSTVGGIPEMISNDVNGYLTDNTDVGTLVAALDKLHNNTEKVKALSLQAKTDATNRYHCRSVAEKTLSFYKELI